ncbi:hypothetical protein ACF1GW_23035 [Streptomyces achromogenes]|uniref:hypothetical protein n=1 Tax=Streptomyces achromogenes TaxID=67255 RepID=UPI0036FFE599
MDGAPWDRPVVTGSSGAVLRVMSPVHSPVGFGSPDARGATAARLSAALNRGALLVPGGDNQPDGVPPSGYYQERS